MNRDHFSVPCGQLPELQLHHQPHHHFQHHHYNTSLASSSATSYDMRAGCSGDGGAGPPPQPASALLPAHHQRHHDQRKRRISDFSDDYEAMSACKMPHSASHPEPMAAPISRRRKGYSYSASSAYDDDGEDSRSTRTLPDKRQNHSEIEKRRRDKMNTYIMELSAMIPACAAMARKLDKLTVLRMAVQHLRTVRGTLSSCPLTSCPRPAYVTERELNDLVLAVGRDSFVLVVSCDRGRVLYVSTSVANMLHYDKSDLLGQSVFDILHPKDVAKVKEQLSSSDLRPRERLIDAKTMLPVKAETARGATRLCPGARRSFFCRIKSKGMNSVGPAVVQGLSVKKEIDASGKMSKKHERKYCVVQCTGYLKSWAPVEISENGDGGEEEACNVSCLVGVVRAVRDLAPRPVSASAPLAPPTRKMRFLSRHANDGKYLFVDQRVTLALGFLPQELLGTSVYEYVGGGAEAGAELAALASAHKAALVRREAQHTPPYSVRRKDGSLVLLQTHFKPFRNPWTKDLECLLAENTVLSDVVADAQLDDKLRAESVCGGAGAGAGGGAAAEYDAEVQRLIDSQVESHKIGSAIAEEALRCSPGAGFAVDLPADLFHEALLYSPAPAEGEPAEGEPADAAAQSAPENVSPAAAAVAHHSPPSPSDLSLDGNGEAAMAVIMSLLEADAGLGGLVNFSGLPWPLP